jgi:hypothetical protein
MFSSKLVNMPLMMRKFVRALNMFPSSLPRQIYRNASLAQGNLVKASINETRFALNLV